MLERSGGGRSVRSVSDGQGAGAGERPPARPLGSEAARAADNASPSVGLETRCRDAAGQRARLASGGIAERAVRFRDSCLSVLRVGPADGPQALLLHGVTYSSGSVFDLSVPGRERADCSLMLRLASRGIGVWALDFGGYGLSDTLAGAKRHGIGDYVDQVETAVRVVSRATSRFPVLVGWSWGAQVASRFAGLCPELSTGLVFWGGLWGGTGQLDFIRTLVAPDRHRRVNTEQHAGADFRHRLSFDPAVKAAFVERALELDPTSPTAGLRETILNVPLHDPTRIQCPTLVLHGSLDPSATDMEAFFARLPASLRAKALIDGADHNAQFGHSRQLVAAAIADFCHGIP